MFDTWITRIQGQAVSELDSQILFEALDDDDDCLVAPEVFLRGLRGQVPKRRWQLLEKVTAKLASSPGGNNISWRRARPGTDILDLFRGSAVAAKALSRREFMDYYLNCGITLDDDREFEAVLAMDWPTALVDELVGPPCLADDEDEVEVIDQRRHGGPMPRRPGSARRPASAKRPGSARHFAKIPGGMDTVPPGWPRPTGFALDLAY